MAKHVVDEDHTYLSAGAPEMHLRCEVTGETSFLMQSSVNYCPECGRLLA